MREPIHPSETPRENLDALGMSAVELARRIEVPVNRITQFLNGRRATTGDALRAAACGAREPRGDARLPTLDAATDLLDS